MNFFKKQNQDDIMSYAPRFVKKNRIKSFEENSIAAGNQSTWNTNNIFPDCEVRKFKGSKFAWYPPAGTYKEVY